MSQISFESRWVDYDDECLPDKYWDPDRERITHYERYQMSTTDRLTGKVALRNPTSIYLHQNGQLILKHYGYQYSEGCMVNQGGLVRYIWFAPFNKNWFWQDLLHKGCKEAERQRFFEIMNWR